MLLLLLFVLLYLALNMLEPSPNGWMLFRYLSLSLLFVSVIGDVYFVFSVPLFRFLCRFFCQHKNCFVSVKSLVLLSIVWFRFRGGYFFPIVFYLGSCLGSFLNVCFASFFLFSFLLSLFISSSRQKKLLLPNVMVEKFSFLSVKCERIDVLSS